MRSAGGVLSSVRSRMPVRLISSVRGIGVAVSVSTSTSALSCLICSLWLTPKRCSSSTTSRPRSLNSMSSDSSRWVPMTTSTSPRAHALDHLAGLGRGEEAGQHLDPHRVAGEAVAEGLVVLLGEQRGGHEHRHLLAVLHRLERGPDGDLGLAEARRRRTRGGPSGGSASMSAFTSSMAVSWSGVSW